MNITLCTLITYKTLRRRQNLTIYMYIDSCRHHCYHPVLDCIGSVTGGLEQIGSVTGGKILVM